MRRDSYWKQSAACVLALMLLLVSGGRAESFAMGGSYKAQAQTLYSPGKVIVADDEPAGGSGGSADGAGGSGEAQITSVGGDGGQTQQAGDAGQAQQGDVDPLGHAEEVQVGSAEQQQPQQHVPGPGPGHGPDHGAPLVVVLPVPLPPGGVQVSGGQQLRHGAEEQEAACKAKKPRHSGGSGGKRPRRPEGGPR